MNWSYIKNQIELNTGELLPTEYSKIMSRVDRANIYHTHRAHLTWTFCGMAGAESK